MPSGSRFSPSSTRLMLVGGPADCSDLAQVVREAYAGGLRLFQLREKGAVPTMTPDDLQQLLADCPQLQLLINGRPRLALALSATLHLPQADPVPRDYPASAPWGRSVHDLAAGRQAARDGASYLVLGTIFPTASKPGHPGAGLELVREVCAAVDLPVFAIGGMDAECADRVRAAGAHGVAVQRAVLAAASPRQATRDLLQSLS